jgi:DNA-binding MarR family transcriptional regulator
VRITEGGFLITKIHHLAGRIFSRKLKEYDIEISPGQGRILFALWRNDGISIMELAKRTSLGKSTLTDMLDRLADTEYLKRVPSQSDRRKTLVMLTEKTKKLHQKYTDVSREMTELTYRNFEDDEITAFEGYLERVLKNLVEFDRNSQ